MAPSTPIPPLIRRNTLYVAASQACTGAGMGLLPTMGALMVVQMLGSTALSGLAVALLGVSRFVVAYPTGMIADRYGRRTAMALAFAVGIAGALLSGIGMTVNVFSWFMLGVFVFGLAVGATLQLRVAAADMYPPERRGEGLGYVVTGATVGAVGGGVLVWIADVLARQLGGDALTLTWWLVPLVLAPALVLVLRVHPDPREIAANLEQYYPGYIRPARPVPPLVGAGRFQLLRDPAKMAAYAAAFAVQGNMSMMMVASALVLAHHGNDLPTITLSTTFHSLGMFAFAIPQGRLADRFGRPKIMLAGLALGGAGTVLEVVNPGFGIITFGFFLVGFGWSCVNVAATAFLADVSQPDEVGRAIGTSDTFSGAANVLLALATGPLVVAFGFGSLGLVAIALMLVPAIFLVRLRTMSRAIPPDEFNVT